MAGLVPTSWLNFTVGLSGFAVAHVSRSVVAQGFVWSIVLTEVSAPATPLARAITALLAQMSLNLPAILKLPLTASCSSHSSF